MKLLIEKDFWEKFLKSKWLLGVAVFVLALKISFSLIYINLPNSLFFADIAKSELVNMLNQTRQAMGLNALTENLQLDQAAQLKAQDMVANEYFNHISPSGTTPWYWFSAAGYNYKYAGDNLAIGFYDSAEVYQAWLNSASHKENMISPYYTEVGTAVLTGFGNNNAIVVVQLFGTQNKATASQSTTKTIAKTEEIPEIQPTTIGNSPAAEKVLSSSIVLKADDNSGAENKFLSFIFSNYQNMLQYAIYIIMTIVAGALFYSLSLDFNGQMSNGVALRSLTIIVILASSALINAELIASVLPHQIII